MRSIIAERSRDKRVEDKVFTAAKAAMDAVAEHGDRAVNATLGVLVDEGGKLVTFDEVWSTYLNLDVAKELASYSASFKGEGEYLEELQKWVFRNIDRGFYSDAVATPGGTGAVGSTFKNYLDPGEEILIPHIGWEPYWIMATENEFTVSEYKLFDGEGFNLKSFKERSLEIMEKQGKVMAVINDPCHNPTGYSLSMEEWRELAEFLNDLSKRGPVILLNDIAYIDFSYKGVETRKYMELFNNNSENFLVILAFSISKTLTAYGLRTGAQVAISTSKEVVDDFVRANEFTARSMWSNIPKGGMKLLSKIFSQEEHLNKLIAERQGYIDLLRERSDIFLSEAREAGLPMYPYRDGFFVTLKTPEAQEQDRVYKRLKEKLIFTIKVNDGIRVAICSLSKRKIKGLAVRMKEAFDE